MRESVWTERSEGRLTPHRRGAARGTPRTTSPSRGKDPHREVHYPPWIAEAANYLKPLGYSNDSGQGNVSVRN